MINTYNSEHTLWVEKYRPVGLVDYIGNEHLKTKIQSYIDTEDFPHLLLYGSTPGTGKTSAAKMIANSLGYETLFINCSDENSVDVIREKIKSFASTVSFHNFKIIILDEADFGSLAMQAALRGVMEQYSEHVRFILTCNYVDRIIPAIQSRCQIYQVIPPNKKQVAQRVVDILNQENIKFNITDLVPFVDTGYPDIRKVIGLLQQHCVSGELRPLTNVTEKSSYTYQLIECLQSVRKGTSVKDAYNKVRILLAEAKMKDYVELYRMLYDEIDSYAEGKIGQVILIIAEHQYKDTFSVNKDINVSAMMAKIFGIL